MKKRISIICICMITALLSVGSVMTAYAGSNIDVNKDSSIAIQYRYNGEVFSGVAVKTYKVADVNQYGKHTLCGEFASLPVSIEGVTSQSEWSQIATTLSAYAIANRIEADCSDTTGTSGTVVFRDIKPGMYLTMPATAESDDYAVAFDCFLTAVPLPDGRGNYKYDVTVYPKGDKYDITPDELNYSVIKQWKDAGFTEKRPEKVQVDIYKNDDLMYRQELSSENNWSFSWSAEDDGSVWHVIEYDVPPEYSVRVVTRGETIIVTNTYEYDPGQEEPSSSSDPTTEPPSSDEPSSSEPTTEPPSSDEPTTIPPTEPSSGDEPTTEPDVPTSQEPATEPPSSDEPTTIPPTEPSSGDEPTTAPDEPTSQEPTDVTEEPTEQSGTQASKEPTTKPATEQESEHGEKVPQTGDTTSLWPYVFAMCISGSLLMIFAMWRKREEE